MICFKSVYRIKKEHTMKKRLLSLKKVKSQKKKIFNEIDNFGKNNFNKIDNSSIFLLEWILTIKKILKLIIT